MTENLSSGIYQCFEQGAAADEMEDDMEGEGDVGEGRSTMCCVVASLDLKGKGSDRGTLSARVKMAPLQNPQ